MSGIFNPAIFNNAIFNIGVAGEALPLSPIIMRPGDGGKPKRRIIHAFKPMGLLARRKRIPDGRKSVDERFAQSLEIQAEVASEIARRAREGEGIFTEEPPIAEMSLAEIESEIGILLQKKMKTEEDEMILFLLTMAAVS